MKLDHRGKPLLNLRGKYPTCPKDWRGRRSFSRCPEQQPGVIWDFPGAGREKRPGEERWPRPLEDSRSDAESSSDGSVHLWLSAPSAEAPHKCLWPGCQSAWGGSSGRRRCSRRPCWYRGWGRRFWPRGHCHRKSTAHGWRGPQWGTSTEPGRRAAGIVWQLEWNLSCSPVWTLKNKRKKTRGMRAAVGEGGRSRSSWAELLGSRSNSSTFTNTNSVFSN